MNVKLICLCIVLLVIKDGLSQSWQSPYFTVLNNSGIEVEAVAPSLRLRMQEELPVPINLLEINYSGPGTPYIKQQTLFLNASIIFFNQNWILTINNRQDYENDYSKLASIKIEIRDDNSTENIERDIDILLINIVDNVPYISYDKPCEVEELQNNYEADCIFEIIHPDTIYAAGIDLSFNGTHNESELFSMEILDQGVYTVLYKLITIKELRYEERAFYNFRIYVTDKEDHSTSISTVVTVIDIESMPPNWMRQFGTQRFPEEESQIFEISATDGDTGIDADICYRLEFDNESYSEFIKIDSSSGVIDILEIDRDQGEDTFEFNTTAYKCLSTSWSSTVRAVIIVDDINDNVPEIFVQPIEIEIYEETNSNLPFTQFMMNDLDMGSFATYTVEILSEDNSPIPYHEAFGIIPNRGYKETNFTCIILNASILDFDNRDWQSFKIVIRAVEDVVSGLPNVDVSILIHLINWNDEVPEFEDSEYAANVLESIGSETYITTVKALDRDIGDQINYSIVGSNDFQISEDGVISTVSNQAFDFERQRVVILQIRAVDSLVTDYSQKLNTAFMELTINVEDVNDETPDIRVPRLDSIEENALGGTVITADIYANDPDLTANLNFTINWDNSYASKAGQDSDTDTYVDCFIIETTYDTESSRFYGRLLVNPNFDQNIDYEAYDVIYLHIIVTDLNQEINQAYADATLTLRIVDVNDNAPEFPDFGEDFILHVIEEADEDTIIGTIYAIDKDGPLYNQITYSINPTNGTEEGLVKISPGGGSISVAGNIQCDEPVLFELFYVITASDGIHDTTTYLTIGIIDINNQFPQFNDYQNTSVREDAPAGHYITTITAHDIDRDAPHNLIRFSIDYYLDENVFKYFHIDDISGEITSKGDLDREQGESVYIVSISITDNYLGNKSRTNSNSSVIHITINDFNDNAPLMPNPNDVILRVSENNMEENIYIGKVEAIDLDELDNARLGYTILSITAGGSNADPLPDNNTLFDLLQIDSTGEITTNGHLRGFYGKWVIEIEAYDHGHLTDSEIQLRSSEAYEIIISEFNFNKPVITYPTNDQIYRLNVYNIQPEAPIELTNGKYVPNFEATDNDGGIYGDVMFSVKDADTQQDSEYFVMYKISRQVSQIRVKAQELEVKQYMINVEAVDGGLLLAERVTNIMFVIVDSKGVPYFNFDDDPQSFHFTENTTGLSQIRIIPEATDPKNAGITEDEDIYTVYYFIDPNYNSQDVAKFTLDSITRELKLAVELDREEIEQHSIRIIATNIEDQPPSNPDPKSMLIVTIYVDDINDNPPEFTAPQYGAGITPNDLIGKTIVSIAATDPDLNEAIDYTIDSSSLLTVGTNLDGNIGVPFILNRTTGEVKLNFGVSESMAGYLTFEAVATDRDGFTARVVVKIYIIAEANRVTFRLLNEKDDVENRRAFIMSTLSQHYKYECNIDDIQTQTNVSGAAVVNITDVRAHFIKENFEAVSADEIIGRSSDVIFITNLKSTLSTEYINLMDVPSNKFSEILDMNQLIIILLGVIIAVMGVVCIVLFGAYFIRTRSLNRQLKALSDTQFGSTNSNLNRREAPNTNVFSVEGSNPVLNNNNVQSNIFDNMSIDSNESDESDFVGIDKDPTFINEKKESNNSSVNEMNKKNLNFNNSFNEKDDYSNRDSQLGTYRF